MTATLSTTEGEVAFAAPGADKPCKTWYKVVGSLDSDRLPLIALHGGPGAGHEYLSPLTDLHRDYGIPIIFYDQVGCGRSTHFPEKMGDVEFWSFNLFTQELDNLIDTLNLREKGFYLLGQSWGGLLCGLYASRRPKGLQKAIVASGPASMPLYVEGVNRLLAQLPSNVRKVLEEGERTGDRESSEYEKAAAVFYSRHVCRLDAKPDDVQAAFKNLKEDPTAYLTIQGPSEFVITGSMKEWEGWQDAHNIEVDTLLLNGRYDEVTDLCMSPWFSYIPRVKWITLENSAHLAHWEDRERYIQVCGDFLCGK
ncbi:Alpha/Beta hydrolase protein [Apodospora peruviana]|uniref:Alpha/Beta hydrolase protein n=1 Tax=Apodospora peruviana TaxID=516989 RepID=A0AAE0LYP3_9PEZI|nr:Alpha/Beta hydrolase protein [Apodospora peruviana]